jgi:ATP-dependent helicase IRC3
MLARRSGLAQLVEGSGPVMTVATVPAIEPRPYQREAVEAVLRAYERGLQRVLVSLPTGTGKTIVFALVAKERGGRTLILVHRDELVRQAVEKLSLVWPEASVGIVKAELDQHDAHVVVASVQTLARPRRLERVTWDFSTVIVDEAHHAVAPSYERILEAVGAFQPGGPLVLGVTATPERADKKALGKVFQEIVYRKTIEEMVLAGYLCDVRALRVQLAVSLDKVKVKGGDYDEKQLSKALLDAGAPRAIAEACLAFAADRKTVVFVPSVRLAFKTAEQLRARGIAAAAVHGGTPVEERRGILEKLRNGTIRAVANCMVLTEGFDEPSVDGLVIARPTLSRPLYIQMVGRGLRIWPGKEDCLILDVVGVTERHDLVTAETLFNVDGETLERDGLVAAIAQRSQDERFLDVLGELVARPVELLGRRKLHWVYTGEVYVVPTVDGRIVLRPNIYDGSLWDVVRQRRGWFMDEVLGEKLPLEWALGKAEDAVREDGALYLADPKAKWRTRPATQKQIDVLRRWGIPIPKGLTCGQASDLITAGRDAARMMVRRIQSQ